MAFLGDFGKMLFGRGERKEQVSDLTSEQQNLFKQMQAALQGEGAEGAFGNVADYYRGLLGGDSETQQQMEAPLMRQFNEDIMPGISEQFAGMGSGGLSSSGFMNQAGRASTDLGERLGAIRAQLRQQGVQGLQGLASQGMNPIQESVIRPREQGLLGGLAEGAGQGLGMAAGYGMMGGGGALAAGAKKLFSSGGGVTGASRG